MIQARQFDHAAQEQGFTLIELLASLLAGSLLLLWLGWAVGGISEQWMKSGKHDPVRELADNRLQIVHLIEGALYPVEDDALPMPTASRINFITVPPRAIKGVTLTRLTFSVETGKDGSKYLTAALTDIESDRVLAPPSALTSGWKDIRILSEEAPAKGLRPLVELAFTAPDGENFAILARPRINAEPGCEFDPISMECRQ